jgi:hypothetical protein
MSPQWNPALELLQGPLWLSRGSLPIGLTAVVCDLQPRFIPKGRAGRGFRAIARNGRVLLASHFPFDQLKARCWSIRFQLWNRIILPGQPAEPFGLVCWVGMKPLPFMPSSEGIGDPGRLETGPTTEGRPVFGTQLVRNPEEGFDLTVDVGGRTLWEFRRLDRSSEL